LSPDDYPHPTSQAVSAVMRANPRANTKPEVRVRSALHALGYRFRKGLPIEAAGIRVRPDIVFPRRRVAVFIDGCFWHSCPEHGNMPESNTHYWKPKLERNAIRDARVTEALKGAGWHVVRIWEHVPEHEAIAVIESSLRNVQGRSD
jgi:DNA mismatch endonuclease (patch repair protein)